MLSNKHIAIATLTRALNIAAKHFEMGNDENEMLFPVECVNVDDALLWCVRSVEHAQLVWVVTFPSIDGAAGHVADADEIAQIDAWR